MQEQRRIVVGDADFADRLRLGRDRRPQPDPLQHQLRPVGDRRRAPVERLAEHRRRVLAVDHRDRKPGIGAGDAEQQPVQPAARDQELDIVAHRQNMGGGGDAVHRRSSLRGAAGAAAISAGHASGTRLLRFARNDGYSHQQVIAQDQTVPLNPELDSLSDYPFEALRTLLNPVTPRVNDEPIPMSVGEPQHQPPRAADRDARRARA